ncbi:MAG: thermonuclease family protein [Actinomycetota bacterium]
MRRSRLDRSLADYLAVRRALGYKCTAHLTAPLSTLIGLLATTGMRVGEAILLDRSDVPRGVAALVVRVIDGDTVELRYQGRTESVRLIGVDTPETVHPFEPVE